VVPDERAAAFVALGIAQQTGVPTALVCTSGTAALNWGPAVAEAFFQRVPLLLLTADRPPEWVDQWDGQTIRQRNVYGAHVKWSAELPVSHDHPDARRHLNRLVNEAILYARAFPAGPTHLNVPIREPFYPTPGEPYTFGQGRVIEAWSDTPNLSTAQYGALAERWADHARVLIVAGQHRADALLRSALTQFAERTRTVVVGDALSNLHDLPGVVTRPDALLRRADARLRPDLLITFGMSVISKQLKLYLRTHSPHAHWHLQPAGTLADPYQSITHLLRVDPTRFFEALANELPPRPPAYAAAWREAEGKARKRTDTFFADRPFSEFGALQTVLRRLPTGAQLHVGNSTPVRYVNFLGVPTGRDVTLFANRGTSGIDGSSSTAVGAALATERPVVLITGDVAFFYDRNAFWLTGPLPPHLRVILLNNHGGGIFRLIRGPRDQPELVEYFETRQPMNAARTAADFGLQYTSAKDGPSLQRALEGFFTPTDGPHLLEIETDAATNEATFRAYGQQFE
ncbi:MAG: 2-succinyl-5-enolpyruvyl-6-hydroxy-3-cyclohexene-1-carboxylic-acid synthase, partial [Catalinimonas sp.]